MFKTSLTAPARAFAVALIAGLGQALQTAVDTGGSSLIRQAGANLQQLTATCDMLICAAQIPTIF